MFYGAPLGRECQKWSWVSPTFLSGGYKNHRTFLGAAFQNERLTAWVTNCELSEISAAVSDLRNDPAVGAFCQGVLKNINPQWARLNRIQLEPTWRIVHLFSWVVIPFTSRAAPGCMLFGDSSKLSFFLSSGIGLTSDEVHRKHAKTPRDSINAMHTFTALFGLFENKMWIFLWPTGCQH